MDYFSVVAVGTEVHLFMQATGPWGKGIQHMISKDAGASWTGPTKLNLPAGGPHAPTVGHGVVLSNGDVVVPAVCNASCVLISSDKGKTWAVGGYGIKGSRESSITEVSCPKAAAGAGPCVYINARNMNKPKSDAAAHPRLESWSADGGRSWAPMTASTALFTPVTPHWTGIVANVVALPKSGALVYAGASAPGARASMAVSTSDSGDGHKWGAKRVIWPGPAGYADVAALNSTHVGVLYEAGDKSFADRIQFSVVALKAELTGKA